MSHACGRVQLNGQETSLATNEAYFFKPHDTKLPDYFTVSMVWCLTTVVELNGTKVSKKNPKNDNVLFPEFMTLLRKIIHTI